jgi:xylulokinase
MLSMRGHAERFGMPNPPKRIIATGGASSNDSILKSIAQIFGCPVFTVERPGMATQLPLILAQSHKLVMQPRMCKNC